MSLLVLATSSLACARQAPEHVTPQDVFAYDEASPLDVSLEPDTSASGLADADGARVEQFRVSYSSPGGGRVTGLLVLPRVHGRHAGVILQHGMPQSSADVADWARTLAAHGAVVLAPDAPFARRAGPPLRFTPQDSVEQVQIVMDLQRAVDFLHGRPDVDPRRIAYVGYSYGAAMGALFSSVERRLATAILVHGDGGLVAHGTGPDDAPGGPPSLAPGQWDRWLAAMRPIEPLRFLPQRPRIPMLLQAAENDEFVPAVDSRQLHGTVPPPREVRWYPTRHEVSAAALHDQLEWLGRHVGTAAPAP